MASYKALVKRSNILANIHWTSLLSEMLDRFTTMFSHPTLCSAMFGGICSRSIQANILSTIFLFSNVEWNIE